MTIRPIARDDNGHPLAGHGTETVTRRFTDVDTGGQAVSLGTDVKEALIHIEGAIEVIRFTGSADGSEQIRITQDGTTLGDVPIVKEANGTIITVAAPSGTVNVSVIGWR